MKVQVDCYSKEEYSVQLDVSGQYPVAEGPDRDGFLFACFALRQLRNNEGHMIADALASLLDIRPLEVLEGKEPMHSAARLIAHKRKYELLAQGVSEREADLGDASAVFQFALQHDSKMEYLDVEILSHVPNMKLKKYQGDAKKQFVMTLPPLHFALRGFGALFGDVRHYALISTMAVLRAVSVKHSQNTAFRDKLVALAASCGRAYLLQKIPLDQASFARSMMSGVS